MDFADYGSNTSIDSTVVRRCGGCEPETRKARFSTGKSMDFAHYTKNSGIDSTMCTAMPMFCSRIAKDTISKTD